MSVITPEEITEGGLNVPIHACDLYPQFAPSRAPGAARYRHTLPGGQHLDALLVNKTSDVLVVCFHGALDRDKNTLPRFERLRTVNGMAVSAMYVGDPTLWMDDRMRLSWYVGWPEFDAQGVIADWAVRAAQAVGASHIIFTGSSGGGFAALQVSALVPNSLALPFNPQTMIYQYRPHGKFWFQRSLMRAAWPNLAPEGVDKFDFSTDWTAQADDRMSAVRRYAQPVPNFTRFVINRNEDHYEGHYVPWLEAAHAGGNRNRVEGIVYEGGTIHGPPAPRVFNQHLQEALEYVQELPPVDTVNEPPVSYHP